MFARTLVLEDKTALNDSGTKTINLDFTDKATEIEVRFDATNGATYNKKSPLAGCVTKIEVVDGSDVLFSVDGWMNRGLFAGLEGFVPQHYMTEVGGDTPYESFPIRFGRFLNDTIYAFNPAAFINPQLKISWDLAKINTVGATGYLTAYAKLSVNVKLMEDVEEPRGFFMTKEVEDFTSATSGDHITELPSDYNYRAIALRAFVTATDIRSIITNLKLSLDADKRIPFNLALEDIIYAWLNENHPLHSLALLVCSDATFSETWVGMSLGGTLSARNTDVIVGNDTFWKGGIYPYLVNGAGTAQTNKGVFAHDVGACYNNVVVVPFGRKDVPETWLQKSGFKSAKLYSTQGAAAAIQIAVQQERLY